MDRRTRAQQRADEIDISPSKLLAQIEQLTGERDAVARERDDYLAALQRERAEFVNFKRRTAEERQQMLGLAAEGLISKVLALADDFDRAIEARPTTIADDPWVEGIAAIDRKLRQLLESEGVSPIAATPGTPFDPREHEAVASVPGTDHPGGAIVGELRRGYRLRDRVLRPALVAVAAHDETAPGGESASGGDIAPGGESASGGDIAPGGESAPGGDIAPGDDTESGGNVRRGGRAGRGDDAGPTTDHPIH